MPRKKSARKLAEAQAATATTKTDNGDDMNARKMPVVDSAAAAGDAAGDDDNDDDDSSTSEEEDEFGELITENVESGIQQVLDAIKRNDPKLSDPNYRFFEDPEKAVANLNVQPKEKPLYLKDYHRKQILSGGYKDEDEDDEEEEMENEYGTVDGKKPYVVEKQEEKDAILAEIKDAFDNAASDDEDDDGEFMKKKEAKIGDIHDAEPSLPDPNADAEAFLQSFLDQQAWIPKKTDKMVNLDRIDADDAQEFEEAAEQFEHAYNFRYEDKEAAEIVSYARDQASMRREKTSARARKRQEQREAKRKEKEATQEALTKKKNQKVNLVMDRLAEIKKAVGGDVSDEVIERVFGKSLLNDEFNDDDWDAKMAEIFNEQFADDHDANVKPEWDDEDDEAIAGFEDAEIDMDADSTKTTKTKKKKSDKKQEKKSKEALKSAAARIVESATLDLFDEIVEERGRSREADDDDGVVFKYREVSPESFGLSTRDILVADDKQLGQFLSMKKLAPYRSKEDVQRDKRKYAKRKRVREWRKNTFGSDEPQPADGKYDVLIPTEDEPPSKKKRTK
ncbi:hypothetical protein DIURU_001011 [Diutina rugosa]|uniref:Kri1-like C-terminal domain-containing protein n=1 Tax=Diutina rugosa TaxID=5481 RepID=A0A642UW43_DIURU|nr:uncharacterized protein DIURU_001011 [Diutina rugosa]KAA8906602.1 hypothetical protein DIURU_001011 [Diutina rugosa]